MYVLIIVIHANNIKSQTVLQELWQETVSSWPTLASQQSGGCHFRTDLQNSFWAERDDQAVDTSQIPGVTLGCHTHMRNINFPKHSDQLLRGRALTYLYVFRWNPAGHVFCMGLGGTTVWCIWNPSIFNTLLRLAASASRLLGWMIARCLQPHWRIFQAESFCGFLSTHSIVILAFRICLNLSIFGYTILLPLYFIALGFFHFEHFYFYLIKISGGTGVYLIYPEWEHRSCLNFPLRICLLSSALWVHSFFISLNTCISSLSSFQRLVTPPVISLWLWRITCYTFGLLPCLGLLVVDFHLPLAYDHLLCSRILAVSPPPLPNSCLNEIYQRIGGEVQGRAAVQFTATSPAPSATSSD